MKEIRIQKKIINEREIKKGIMILKIIFKSQNIQKYIYIPKTNI